MYLMEDIVKEGTASLYEKCAEVKLPLTADDIKCLEGLHEYLVISEDEKLTEKYNIRPGVGIAAPQVGYNKRMFSMSCVDFLDENETKYSYTFINPQIIAASKEMTYLPSGEGCLSVDRCTDGLVTPRHYAIKVKGMIYDFEKKRPKYVTMYLEGYPAIVFQHENDHLDGILYTSKMFKPEEIDAKPLYTIPDEEENKENE